MDGEGLRAIRKSEGLTQAKMAAELGVSRQSYIAWEADKYQMPEDKVKLLMDGSATRKALMPKETDKQRVEREQNERRQIKHDLLVYRAHRAFCRNHNEAMKCFDKQGHVFSFASQLAIVAEFPDIQTDPDGDHPMNKAQIHAAIYPPKDRN